MSETMETTLHRGLSGIRSAPWRRASILWPVVLVATCWIGMSLGTSAFLYWMESEYSRVFSENFTSIDSAASLESAVWRTVARWSDDSVNAEDVSRLQAEVEAELNHLTDRIRQSCHTENELRIMQELRQTLAAFLARTHSHASVMKSTRERAAGTADHLSESAEHVVAQCQAVRQLNERMIDQSRERLASIQRFVMLLRMGMLLLGPMLGLYFGWRVAGRLQSSVAEIAVTLDSGEAGRDARMHVRIRRESTIEDVRRQAERVVEQLRLAGQELQTARREVIRAERLAAVGELAAGVAHELRNPLTSVKLLLQHAARQSSGGVVGATQFELVLSEVARMETTIQGLLDFARTPELHRVRHDLRETVQRSLNLVDGRIRQAQIELSATLGESPLMVDGDAEQLKQVFVNLLLNAIEAAPTGGRVRVASRRTGGHDVEVIVTDNGHGVPPGMLEHLFEPFVTTRHSGTGLGLAVSLRIVQEHAGTIEPVSSPETGTTFTVRLPGIRAAEQTGDRDAGKTADCG